MTVAGLALCLAGIDGLSLFFKMTASTGFLWTALAAGAFRSPYGRAILAGLVCSWFGDLFLGLSGDAMFLMGLVAFLLGHLAYCWAYINQGAKFRRAAIAFAVLLVPAAMLIAWLWPGVPGGLRIPVLAYTLVISAMVALAVGVLDRPGGLLIVSGAVLFYCSDIFVARSAFVESDSINRYVGLPLYFGGQILLAASIARANRMWLDDPDGD